MNILFFLTPKSEVAYIYEDYTMRQALEKMEYHRYSSIPIINGLTDDEHPCQVLADLMTIREKKLILEGLKVAYIGDGNNMCNSLLVGCLTLGMHIYS